METNERLQHAIVEALNNQLQSGDPPETKETQRRLLAAGISEAETERLLSCVLAGEIFAIMKHQETFNRERFVDRLRKLPEMPWMDDD